MGDQAFFSFLQRLHFQIPDETFGMAASGDFFLILGEHTSADITSLMEEYFRDLE
jgi:hypothetical protein